LFFYINQGRVPVEIPNLFFSHRGAETQRLFTTNKRKTYSSIPLCENISSDYASAADSLLQVLVEEVLYNFHTVTAEASVLCAPVDTEG